MVKANWGGLRLTGEERVVGLTGKERGMGLTGEE